MNILVSAIFELFSCSFFSHMICLIVISFCFYVVYCYLTPFIRRDYE